MTTNELLQNIMPCGCVCYTCTGCAHGAIALHAKDLLYYLEGMEEFRANQPDYEAIATTMGALRFWATQNCPGCRVDGPNQCTYADCPVCDCAKAHAVDFCYLCTEYPCANINKVAKWRTANDYMLHHGPQAYWEQEKQLPHYRDYKNQTAHNA